MVTFEASAGKDSVLNSILSGLDLSGEYKWIEADDKRCINLERHVETELDGSENWIDGDKTVCTHVKKETAEDKINNAKEDAENKINDEIEKQKQSFMDEIEAAIEDMIEDFLIQSCGGCS